MAAKPKGKSGLVLQVTQLIEGTEKHFPTGTSVTVGSGTFTAPEIASRLQALVTLRKAVDAAKAQTREMLAAEAAAAPALRTLAREVAAFARVVFRNKPAVLADFGIYPKARAPQTVEARAAANAKRAATRVARHTMGSKQKKAIKGGVTGVTIVPVEPSTPK
jgi:hypothetical protein